ncbi:MAG TPA: substrate-binding domain-containing protein [Pyrinomonadaceae bacterium]|jgi:ribose transport system substrate-binding protein
MRLNVHALCLALTFGALLAASGCQGGGGNSGGKRIGVTLLTREHVFYKDLEAGLQEAADKAGYQLIVTAGEMDLARQQSQIENFIVQKVDAIILCPADSKGIGPAIELANRAGIPVFTADIAAQGGQVVSHIASDNLSGGRLAAEFIAKALNGQGEVGIIGQQEVQTGLDRELGFKEEMKKHPGIKVAAVLNGGGRRDSALKAAEDMLQGNPNLKGVFGINDDSALGALSAAESRGKNDLVIVGYDAIPEAVSAIKRGSALKADVAQQPRDLGAKTIEAIGKHFAGAPVEKSIAVPVKIVDADSLK